MPLKQSYSASLWNKNYLYVHLYGVLCYGYGYLFMFTGIFTQLRLVLRRSRIPTSLDQA